MGEWVWLGAVMGVFQTGIVVCSGAVLLLLVKGDLVKKVNVKKEHLTHSS